MDKNKNFPHQPIRDPEEPKNPTFPSSPTARQSVDPSASKSIDYFPAVKSEIRRAKPGADAVAAALEAVQRMAAEAGAEEEEKEMESAGQEFTGHAPGHQCSVCGYQNRQGNRFCGMCGQPVVSDRSVRDNIGREDTDAMTSHARSIEGLDAAAGRYPSDKPSRSETHHYHHHYHHFLQGAGLGFPRAGAEPVIETERRASVPRAESLNRAEAAVRRVTQEWVVACNTKHLDDLLDLYIPDALLLRSNYPPVRGTAAVREFFFAALEAGLGEVEVEPMRLHVAADLAYEAGRCKALVPGTTGKRREERGKYLWVFARQSDGEWKLASDCWSSDLTLPGPAL